MRAQLERSGAGPEQQEEILRRLGAAGYLDDSRYARERARVLTERGYGDAYVRAELGRRGVEPEVVEEALASVLPEDERAAALVRRLGGGSRTAQRLARKGFARDTLERVLGETVAQEP